MQNDKDDDLKLKQFLNDVKKMHQKPKPELDDIWSRLGPFATKIKIVGIELIQEGTEFLTRVGKPYVINWPEPLVVKQVYSLEEAIKSRKSPELVEIQRQAIKEIDRLIDENNRKVQADAIRDLMIHYIHGPLSRKYPDELAWYIPSDFELALTEFILCDVGEPTFFRERWAWYDAGHFPCGTLADGTRIIY